MTTQPETARIERGPVTKVEAFALGMAALLEREGRTVAAAELRRLHAENESLRAALAEPVQEPVALVEQLWAIIDDIDTYSDMAKADDKLYRSLVERRQADRWKTGITTDGYTLSIPSCSAPPQRKPLTEEEIDGLMQSIGLRCADDGNERMANHAEWERRQRRRIARAVERAHGIV